MRVLVLPSWYPTAGNPISGSFFAEQTELLREVGTDISLVYCQLHSIRRPGLLVRNLLADWRSDSLSWQAVESWPRPPRRSGDRLFQLRMKRLGRRLIERNCPDVLLALSARFGGAVAADLSLESGIPFVVAEHSSAFHRHLGRVTLDEAVANAFRSAAAVTAVSTSLAHDLSKIFDIPIPQVVGNPVTLPKPTVTPNIRNDTLTLAVVGSLLENKRVATVVEALSIVINEYQIPATLRIVGTGPELAALKALASELRIRKSVTFVGHLSSRDELARELDRCNILTSASEYETFGLTIAEAAVMGRPVAITDSGGPADHVSQREGEVADGTSAPDLAAAIVRCARRLSSYDPVELSRRAQDRFSPNVFVKNMLSVLERVVDSSGGRPSATRCD